jgi:hypothetical protein
MTRHHLIAFVIMIVAALLTIAFLLLRSRD